MPTRATASEEPYPQIGAHGLIGDLQTAALVTTTGTIDWCCLPRFDSPSVFASLIDSGRGGRCSIAPVNSEYRSDQFYFPDTAILITRFMAAAGVAEVVDFMPIDRPEIATDHHRIVRVVRGIRGALPLRLSCEPRFDYGRSRHTVNVTSEGAVFETPALSLTVHGAATAQQHESDVHDVIEVSAGEAAGVIIESAALTSPRRVERDELVSLFEEAVRFWRGWLAKSDYRGRWRETVHRSAMSLKLMTYAPTGALVAAPTAGLPEQLGGERNWDYRFTWVRDGSFSIRALLSLGYHDEAEQFGRWLGARVAEHVGTGSGPLKIMYRVDGSSDLEEEALDLEGYRGSRPVRIGNGAADQLQLDIYGELMDSIYLADLHTRAVGLDGWIRITAVLDWLTDNWDQPDEGVWETRGGRKNFTYGRLMTWVAFDRAIRMASMSGRPGNVARWTASRDAVYNQIVERAWSEKRQAFVQHADTDVLDASLLLMPLVGFIAPKDPRWLSTLRAMDAELVSDSLVYRYDPAASPDGLAGDEGTFSICSFWYVEALARSGRLEEARFAFEKMLTYSNHVGLYSEEISSTGEQLGNFPQAFTHLSLITAAVNLDRELDAARAGVPFAMPEGTASS
jgi:GH15 family glucan-1,4-alpha-glucosidase